MNQDKANHDALDSAVDVIKVTTSLAVGSLVFGIGIIGASATQSWFTRVLALIAATAFLTSIAFGILAQSRVPIMIHEALRSPHDKTLKRVGIIHEALLLIGLLTIALAFLGATFANPPLSTIAAPDAQSALKRAVSTFPKGTTVETVDAIEIVKGIDPNSLPDQYWHVHMHATTGTGKHRTKSQRDIYVNAVSGEATTLPPFR